MSVDRVSGEWRVEYLLMMDGRGCGVCVNLCRSSINFRVCACWDTLSSSADVWSLVKLTDLGSFGWK